MIHKKKINNNIKFDIVVVGAGPMGIAFASGFVGTNIKVAIIDKLPRKIIANPKIDGREIALTHQSVEILRKLNVWRYISNKSISVNNTSGEFKLFGSNSQLISDNIHIMGETIEGMFINVNGENIVEKLKVEDKKQVNIKTETLNMFALRAEFNNDTKGF